jgi:hypothetical protein
LKIIKSNFLKYILTQKEGKSKGKTIPDRWTEGEIERRTEGEKGRRTEWQINKRTDGQNRAWFCTFQKH